MGQGRYSTLHNWCATSRRSTVRCGKVKAPASRSGNRDIDGWISQAIKNTGAGAGIAPYLKWIVMKESSGDPKAQNPTSSAYGLMQFLDDTWKNYGSKTSDPVKQLEYGIRYMSDRYGSPEKAVAFWKKNGWY